MIKNETALKEATLIKIKMDMIKKKKSRKN